MSSQIKSVFKSKKPIIIEVLCDNNQKIIEPFNVK